jgi:hypothetical protein
MPHTEADHHHTGEPFYPAPGNGPARHRAQTVGEQRNDGEPHDAFSEEYPAEQEDDSATGAPRGMNSGKKLMKKMRGIDGGDARIHLAGCRTGGEDGRSRIPSWSSSDTC